MLFNPVLKGKDVHRAFAIAGIPKRRDQVKFLASCRRRDYALRKVSKVGRLDPDTERELCEKWLGVTQKAG